MHPFRRFGLISAFAVAAALCVASSAQTKPASSLPPTPPTRPQTVPLNATAAQPDAATRAHRADVVYASGLLSINADNSSLNQILREIARLTGMKITGGVRDERVFGHYGPASAEVILSTLIDGNSTNVVIRETAENTPAELILTPRNGGPSPPNPSAAGFDNGADDNERQHDREREEDERRNAPQPISSQPFGPRRGPQNFNPASVPPSIPQPANNVNGSPQNTSPTASTLPVTNSQPIDTIPTPSTTPPSNGIVDAPNPPDPGTVNPVTTATPATTGTTPDPNSPNGVKTPEQIYQQLQQLQQQRQQQIPAAPQ
jgi:hypothetical protein